MKIFQALHIYEPYIDHFEKKYDVKSLSFEEHRKVIIKDRFYGLHILKPCINFSLNGFYTLWNYKELQLKWAQEKGLIEKDLKKILYAQIEEFGPDVFYNMSPFYFNKKELDANLDKNLISVCWSASPYDRDEMFSFYSTRLTNVRLHLRSKAEVGYRSDLFNPAYDPAMDQITAKTNKPIDLLFYGQYADDAFLKRNEDIDRLIKLKQHEPELNIELRLQYRFRKEIVVNIPYVRRFLQKTVFPPKWIIKNAESPIFGLDLYDKISSSKIVYNAGADFTGKFKGNMRCFEVLGCGAHMLSDEGIYPDNFVAGQHFTTYKNIDDCIVKIKELLDNDEHRLAIGQQGNEMVRTFHNKEVQWENFQKIISSLS